VNKKEEVLCLYPKDALFVESSINLIASIFLSGSKRYIISAAAARCVNEAGKEILTRKSKIMIREIAMKNIRIVTVVFLEETSVYFNERLPM